MAPTVASVRTDTCFLCDPDPRLVFKSSESFVALLGFGPVIEGYSLIATRSHLPSMFDLPDSQVAELQAFKLDVREMLGQLWSSAVITEHGRVGLCTESSAGHETHCFHAHQLVFPSVGDFSDCLDASVFNPIRAQTFADARASAGHLTGYLYYEWPDGSALVGNASAEAGRQFFRGAVAHRLGHPEWQSWQAHPRLDVVWAARRRLAGIG